MRLRPALLAALVGLTLLAGCSASPAPSPAPAPSTTPPGAPSASVPVLTPPPTTVAGIDLTGTRVLRPTSGLFTVHVPTRFVDQSATSPGVSAIPALAQAIRAGVGALAVDPRSGYAPTVGGFCTRVASQGLDQLADELQESATRTGAPVGTPRVETLPASGTANARVAVTYRGRTGGRDLDVVQAAALAGPGRSCVVTASTDDAARDATLLPTVRDSLQLAGT